MRAGVVCGDFCYTGSMKLFVSVWIGIAAGLSLAGAVYAADPAIVSFSATPNYLHSGQVASFAWHLQNAGGYSFFISCGKGVKIQKDAAVYPCGARFSSTAATDDYLTFTITNVGGGTESVTGRLVPKDGAGQDVDGASQSVAISVTTLDRPIESFSSSTTTVGRGASVTLSWTAPQLGGVNISFDCGSGLRISSSGFTGFLPCGTPIFVNDLSPSSSLSLKFANPSAYASSVRFTLLPAIVPHQYDGSHAVSLTLAVVSDIPPDPVVNSFKASSSTVASGHRIRFSWVTENAVGVNLQFSCGGVTASSTIQQDQLFPCGIMLFDQALTPNGQLAITFHNSSQTPQSATVTLLPSKELGQYDATRGSSVTVWVLPEAVALPGPVPIPAPIVLPGPVSASPGASSMAFTQVLVRGSRGAQVSLLQEFLKRDATLYPEGLVTGFFGPATERAVQRFQARYGIVSGGTPLTTGYGAVGPKTRVKLNALSR